MNRHLFILSILLLSSSCTINQEKEMQQDVYFDLNSFFSKEAARLQSQNPEIEKVVSRNNEEERQRLKIQNWAVELELFTVSDINKPAWKDSYKKQETPQTIKYTTLDPELRTKEIIIQKNTNGRIGHIYIFNKTTNSLYSSTEELNYYPDSLYRIDKVQQVRILGTTTFSITGKLN